MKVNLKNYNNEWFDTEAGIFKRATWFFINSVIFNSYLFPVNSVKRFILNLFGAEIGKGVVIKPSVNIKYPWKLAIGDYSWIGENVWIDNLDNVVIGNHVCLSQGAMLLTGNHNYKKTTFDLSVHGIILEDGVWIGAKALVCPGVMCFSHSVLSAQSVATKNLEAFYIYSGNPAEKIRERVIEIE